VRARRDAGARTSGPFFTAGPDTTWPPAARPAPAPDRLRPTVPRIREPASRMQGWKCTSICASFVPVALRAVQCAGPTAVSQIKVIMIPYGNFEHIFYSCFPHFCHTSFEYPLCFVRLCPDNVIECHILPSSLSQIDISSKSEGTMERLNIYILPNIFIYIYIRLDVRLDVRLLHPSLHPTSPGGLLCK
jgi:hypothetical protein